MANYKEIVTKTILGKGKKSFTNHYSLSPEEIPTTILGCWVINHKFEGAKEKDKIRVKGSSDVNIWYSYDNDTKTIVSKQTISYDELLNFNIASTGEREPEVIIRSLSGPTCTKVEIKDGKIEYDINKELGIEIVGDAKVRIAVNDEEEKWEEIFDDEEEKKVMDQIDKDVNEEFINENE